MTTPALAAPPDAPTPAPKTPPHRVVWEIVRDAGLSFVRNDCMTMAAATAYYTLFSLPPLVMLVLMIAGAVVDAQTFTSELRLQLETQFSPKMADLIVSLADNLQSMEGGGVVATLTGLGSLLFGATGGFAKLQETLNRIWGVRSNPDSNGLLAFMLKRLLSFGMVLALMGMMGLSMMATMLLGVVTEFMGPWLPDAFNGPMLELTNTGLSFALLALTFAAMYKILPDVNLSWRDVWMGGVITAVLFIVGKALISVYIGTGSVGSAFGAAGSIAVLLVWLYYTLVVLLFGAELTHAIATRHGDPITPSRGAVWLDAPEAPDPASPSDNTTKPTQETP